MNEEKEIKEEKLEEKKPEKKDGWTIAQIIGQLLLPVVIAVVGFYISWQDKHHLEENHKIERIANLLDDLASDKEKSNLLALAMIDYLQSKGEVEENLVFSIKGVMTSNESSEKVVKASAELLEKVATNPNSDATTKAAAQNALKQLSEDESSKASVAAQQAVAKTNPSKATEFNNLPPRVYLQIQKDANRDFVNTLQTKLKAANILAPGIEGVSKVPERTEIRYYDGGENTKADLAKIKEILGVKDVVAVDISKAYPDSNVRPRHYEIWLGSNLNK